MCSKYTADVVVVVVETSAEQDHGELALKLSEEFLSVCAK